MGLEKTCLKRFLIVILHGHPRELGKDSGGVIDQTRSHLLGVGDGKVHGMAVWFDEAENTLNPVRHIGNTGFLRLAVRFDAPGGE